MTLYFSKQRTFPPHQNNYYTHVYQNSQEGGYEYQPIKPLQKTGKINKQHHNNKKDSN